MSERLKIMALSVSRPATEEVARFFGQDVDVELLLKGFFASENIPNVGAISFTLAMLRTISHVVSGNEETRGTKFSKLT